MELPTTNITTTLVGNAIGNSSRNVGVLCTAPTINKWSRKKPVDYSTNWGQNNFGLDFGNTDLSNFVVYDYIYRPRLGDYSIHPTGGYRLGDFRGYNHSAIRPIENELYQTEDTYNYASFFCPGLATSPDIALSEIVATLGGTWTEWHFGVRLTMPDATFRYIVEGTDMLTYLVPGIHFDLSGYVGTRGTITYHAFITPEFSGGLAQTSSLTYEQGQAAILLLPDGIGTFLFIDEPPAPEEPVVVQGSSSPNLSLTGHVTRGEGTVYYTVTNDTGAQQTVDVSMVVTDGNDNVLYPTVSVQITAAVGTNSERSIGIYHSGLADYDQTFTISLTII